MAHFRLFKTIKSIMGAVRYTRQHALTEMQLGDLVGKKKSQYVNIHRRNVIKGAISMAGLYGLSSVTREVLANNYYKRGSIAVIGAGLSGLTAAFRLMQAGIHVQLFEAHPYRYGGRILTRQNFNSDGMYCELGGELNQTTQHWYTQAASGRG